MDSLPSFLPSILVVVVVVVVVMVVVPLPPPPPTSSSSSSSCLEWYGFRWYTLSSLWSQPSLLVIEGGAFESFLFLFFSLFFIFHFFLSINIRRKEFFEVLYIFYLFIFLYFPLMVYLFVFSSIFFFCTLMNVLLEGR